MPKANGRNVSCKTCQKVFYTVPSQNRQFCSNVCRSKMHNPFRAEKAKNGKYIACPMCKKVTYVCPSTLKLNKHGMKLCSRKCLIDFTKKGLAPWGFHRKYEIRSHNPYKRKQIKGVRMTEHRRVMQDHIGRKLKRNEHVHHINENQNDNRIENLQILSSKEHATLHKPKGSSFL
jgi:hypothetical protein